VINESIFAGSIVRSAKRQYSYTQMAILGFFAPQGWHVAQMGVEFDTQEWTSVHSCVSNFTPIGATIRV